MNISRRRFMKAGIVATALAGIPLELAKRTIARPASGSYSNAATSTSLSPASQPDPLYYNKSTFTPYVNTEFSVYLNSSRATSVTLVKVEDFTDSRAASRESGDECFSLQFSGSARSEFKQSTYDVEHGALGKFNLFIVPVGMRTGDNATYQAIFNRRNY